MNDTAERVSSHDYSDNYVYQRCLYAYQEAAKRIHGKVLEIGTGSGIGISYMAPQCDSFTTIDKFSSDIDFTKYLNTTFIQMEIPPFVNIPDQSFDFVIAFQLIEHIEPDDAFVKEIYRVLKKDGKALLTTPNRLQSLTRNPWHIREYLASELAELFRKNQFSNIEMLGTFGNKKVNEYIEKNKASVKRITRFDIFNLQYRLPRKWLQVPYDFFNRMNRKNIAKNNVALTTDISTNDFYLSQENPESLDLFIIATK